MTKSGVRNFLACVPRRPGGDETWGPSGIVGFGPGMRKAIINHRRVSLGKSGHFLDVRVLDVVRLFLFDSFYFEEKKDFYGIVLGLEGCHVAARSCHGGGK
jgi:hypothetical protein